jgi:hypothetical protein
VQNKNIENSQKMSKRRPMWAMNWKNTKSPVDFYFRRKMQFCVCTLNDHDLRPFQHTSEKNFKKILVLFPIKAIYIEEKNDNFAAFLVLNF